MAGEQYGDRAVAELLSYYETNLQTYLTAVETAQSLSTGAMTPPLDYLPGRMPDDLRSPLLQVYCDGGAAADHRNALHSYNCGVLVTYASDADIEAGQLFMRRYMTALVACLAADRTLGDNVVQAIDGEQNFFSESGDGTTSHSIDLSIEVMVFEG